MDQRSDGAATAFAPIDADNHYYKSLDAFTRHLDPAFKQRGVQVVQSGKRVQLLIGERVNRFIPNPTFNPIIVPGCLDVMFRGQVPEGVDPRTLMQVEPLHADTKTVTSGSRSPPARAWVRRCCSPPLAAVSKRA